VSIPGEETVGILAIQQGLGGDWSCGSSDGSNDVDHTDKRIDFAAQGNENPYFFAAMQSFNGPDTATLRYKSLAPDHAVIFVEEERSQDQEMGHTTEQWAYLALWDGAYSTPTVEE